uniref:Cytohesin Ubiquitin Protein Inducing domain-containing protein n=1 Tax=Periophthalmus magnuspinnatus TaxID=409849 RepID=A0A3B4B7G7_9GOBI
TTHTRAMKLKHQALQERLELCLLELRTLCIREAELTGKLSKDYPLKPGEKPPQIRRRVGAAFKLDELSLPQKNGDSDLSAVDAELALQMKIYEAARRLCDEGLSKAVRKSRLQQCKREEQKLKQLQEKAFKLRLEHGRTSPLPALNITQPGNHNSTIYLQIVHPYPSHSSQLFPSEPDILVRLPRSTPSTPSSSLNSAPYTVPASLQLTPCQSPRPSLDSTLSLNSSLALDDPPPIEHSPWSESNLDQPLDPKKKSRSSSKKRYRQKTFYPKLFIWVWMDGFVGEMLSGPESHYNHEKERGRTRSARRRLTEYSITYNEPSPAPSPSLMKISQSNCNHAGSEDSNSDHSYSSYNSSPCHESPCDLPKQYHSNIYSNGSCQPQIFPHASYYHSPKPQSSPKAYYEDMVYPAEMDMGRSYYAQAPPSNRYEYWYKEAPVQQYQRVQRTPEIRLVPPAGVLPKQVVNEQLKSWHRRSSQLKTPRSRSLDRQGAVRFKNTPSPMAREANLYPTPKYQEQVIPRRPQRPLDDTSGHWMVDDGTHYISQV